MGVGSGARQPASADGHTCKGLTTKLEKASFAQCAPTCAGHAEVQMYVDARGCRHVLSTARPRYPQGKWVPDWVDRHKPSRLQVMSSIRNAGPPARLPRHETAQNSVAPRWQWANTVPMFCDPIWNGSIRHAKAMPALIALHPRRGHHVPAVCRTQRRWPLSSPRLQRRR